MAKITTEYVDEWPIMGPLGKKEAEVLAQNLGSDETVLGIVIGRFGQAIVATNKKMLVVKNGFMSGQAFGNKATSFDYRNIVGVEVRKGLTQCEFELLAGGLMNNQSNSMKAKANMANQPNGLLFLKPEMAAFGAMATKIREMTHATNTGGAGSSLGTSENPAIAAIKQLSELHASGILSDEEFNTKKAELLTQI